MPKRIEPQEGPQTLFCGFHQIDIIIYGGSAGGGKSWGILFIPLEYKNVPGFGMTIFRKNYNQIFAQGGLWDEASEMYSGIPGAQVHKGDGSWTFANNGGQAKVSFAHIERDEDLKSWMGSQICGIGFDELTHFSKKVFFYMLSRNRSKCGVKPFIRATCNPDPDSWVAEFIAWWIDQETGYPIPERSGVARWFIRRDEQIYWADHKEELWERFNLVTDEEKEEPKSVTFIMSSVYDNRELLRVNPQYLANLKALPEVDRERLLNGNWKIRPAAGLYFKRIQVGSFVDIVPGDVIQWVRCWDLAATEGDDNDPAYTAGVLMGKRKNGRYIVVDVINERLSADGVRKLVLHTAQQDRAKYKRVRVRVAEDPGQAGKAQAESYIKMLAGFDVTAVRESGSKESRAEPMAAQWQAGNFDVVIAPWNDAYLSQLENFPEGKFKDMVDASANGFTELELRSQFNLSNLL